MDMIECAIVGSGLAAIAAAKALIRRGICPTILDKGETLEPDKIALKQRMSQSEPQDWSNEDRAALAYNPSLNRADVIPRKYAFGSDYFYSHEKLTLAPGASRSHIPPFSLAKGGFSAGWGASVLAADTSDLLGWPSEACRLEDHYRKVLVDIPYCGLDDELSSSFPLYAEHNSPLELTPGNTMLIKRLREKGMYVRDSLVFGQARLLVASSDAVGVACKRCGMCMSGCVYGCIYKAEDELAALVNAGKVRYRSGIMVRSYREDSAGVELVWNTEGGELSSALFDKVFLAAGVVGSTAIVLRSKNLFKQSVNIQSTGSFIMPFLTRKGQALQWPAINTQPGLFLEFRPQPYSDHWVHTQLSTPNELVLQKLGYHPDGSGLMNTLKKWILQRVIIAHCNIHSFYCPSYNVTLSSNEGDSEHSLTYSKQINPLSRLFFNSVQRRLREHLKCIDYRAITTHVQDTLESGGAYHIGGSLPMKDAPACETDTDVLGRPYGSQHVHVVDSSIFPCLPGTTVGLLSMATADRIASNCSLDL